jgi:hypothetical protein
MKNRYRNRLNVEPDLRLKLSAERRQKPKEKCGSRKRVTVADRKVSRRATVARRRRDIFSKERTRVMCGSLKKMVAARRGTTRGAKVAQRFRDVARKRLHPNPRRDGPSGGDNGHNCNNGLRKRNLKELRPHGTGNDIESFTKPTAREIAERFTRSYVVLQTINIWTLWRG